MQLDVGLHRNRILALIDGTLAVPLTVLLQLCVREEAALRVCCQAFDYDAFAQEQYASRNPVRAPAIPLESIHWQMPADIMAR